MSVVTALYLGLLAAVAGYVLIARVPSVLHTPLMSGSNFIHGIVLAGAMLALSAAQSTVELVIGFLAVTAASANIVGGFIVTDRMLALFDEKGVRGAAESMMNPVDRLNAGNPVSLKSSSQPDNAGRTHE